jgi:hypothetical protein
LFIGFLALGRPFRIARRPYRAYIKTLETVTADLQQECAMQSAHSPGGPAASSITRRRFLRTAAAAGTAALAAPAVLRGRNLNEKLNIAIIGCGGRGGSNMNDVSGENIVALCDVNEGNLNRAAEKHPQARKFGRLPQAVRPREGIRRGRRQHLRAHARLRHAAGAAAWQARLLREAAHAQHLGSARHSRGGGPKANVATQMGTQIHAGDNYRRVVELIQTGAIGPVREVHVWVSRAWGWQPSEEAQRHQDIVFVQDRPEKGEPVPAGLNWDLWLGPAPERPFHSVYFPGPKWYRWWDFGSGTMSDLGSHWIDLPFWALQLDIR